MGITKANSKIIKGTARVNISGKMDKATQDSGEKDSSADRALGNQIRVIATLVNG